MKTTIGNEFNSIKKNQLKKIFTISIHLIIAGVFYVNIFTTARLVLMLQVKIPLILDSLGSMEPL